MRPATMAGWTPASAAAVKMEDKRSVSLPVSTFWREGNNFRVRGSDADSNDTGRGGSDMEKRSRSDGSGGRSVRRDDVAPSPFNATRQRRQIYGAIQRRKGAKLESAESEADADRGLPEVPADILHRVDGIVRAMPSDEVEDEDDLREALQILLGYGDSGLSKLVNNPAALSVNEGFAIEAIIAVDGSRPSFLLKEAAVNLTHPFIGGWVNEITAARAKIEMAAGAVGRIQPSMGHASNFIGTGFLISSDPALILTNFHVLKDAKEKFFITLTPDGSEIAIGPGLEIDFAGEATSLNYRRFRCVSARLPRNYGSGYPSVDAALIRIEPTDDDASLPVPIQLSDDVRYANGGMTSLCTIGFPGAPREVGQRYGVDWDWVTTTLFGGYSNFGFKRLAPGRFLHSRGYRGKVVDPAQHAFGHDATTFGGASGSPMLVWQDPNSPCFGLHFAGQNRDSNDAIALMSIRDELERCGARLV